MNLFIYNV